MAPVQDDEKAATILDRRAGGLLALDEALAELNEPQLRHAVHELADANCSVAITAIIAERTLLQPYIVAHALQA